MFYPRLPRKSTRRAQLAQARELAPYVLAGVIVAGLVVLISAVTR